MNAVTVLIVDDHPGFREGVRAILERASGFQITGMAGDAVGAMRLVRERQPDIVVLDLRLPGANGVDVVRWLRSEYPRVAVLAVTGYDDVGYLRALLQMGIRGYLTKAALPDEIVAAVRLVARGGTYLVSDVAPGAPQLGAEPLTLREQEVLRLVAAGLRNDEIAKSLYVSTKTVAFHITHVLAKLGARSRTEAVLKAHQQGILLVQEKTN